jgi:hypothetical protein
MWKIIREKRKARMEIRALNQNFKGSIVLIMESDIKSEV